MYNVVWLIKWTLFPGGCYNPGNVSYDIKLHLILTVILNPYHQVLGFCIFPLSRGRGQLGGARGKQRAHSWERGGEKRGQYGWVDTQNRYFFQVNVARKHIPYHMEQFGYSTPNVQFKLGYIESLKEAGIKDSTCDLVV